MILVTTSTAAMLPARLTLPVTKKLMMNVSTVPTVRKLPDFINERPCPSWPPNRFIRVPVVDGISSACRGPGTERFSRKRICENSPVDENEILYRYCKRGSNRKYFFQNWGQS